ncbi:MAG: hypothetical protein ABIE92_04690 [bacterium]
MKRMTLGLAIGCLCAAATLLAQPQISGPQSGTLGPGTYLVVCAYPNPFNPTTAISFDILKALQVKLEIKNC